LFKGKRKNQKNSQAVSPLNLLSRGGRENQNNSQAVSPLNLLARGRGNEEKE